MKVAVVCDEHAIHSFDEHLVVCKYGTCTYGLRSIRLVSCERGTMVTMYDKRTKRTSTEKHTSHAKAAQLQPVMAKKAASQMPLVRVRTTKLKHAIVTHVLSDCIRPDRPTSH